MVQNPIGGWGRKSNSLSSESIRTPLSQANLETDEPLSLLIISIVASLVKFVSLPWIQERNVLDKLYSNRHTIEMLQIIFPFSLTHFIAILRFPATSSKLNPLLSLNFLILILASVTIPIKKPSPPT